MFVEPASADWLIKQATVCELFESTVKSASNFTYCATPAGAASYRQVFSAVASLARELGSDVEDRDVGILLPNGLSFLVAYHAVLRAGGRPALINVATPPALIDRMLRGMDIALMLTAAELPDLPCRVLSEDEALSLALASEAVEVTPAGARAGDTGVILFSGGTTGVPKRIAHSHRAVIAKMERMEWGWPTGAHETWLPVAPFSHVYGYLMGVVNPILKGAKLVIPERFKPEIVVDLLARERVTVFGGGPPAIYQALLAAENFAEADLSNLRVCPGGGAPFPLALHERWERATGLKIYEGLGMTEIAPLAVNTDKDGIRYGTVGKPCPDTEIQIVDLETGAEVLPAGRPGEIRVRGPHMMTGYEGNPEETANAIRGGYIYTGDIGAFDGDGFLSVTDRKKDVIFTKGFNVFPREIEETLMQLEAVNQVCVVGRADERAGEVAVAFVTTGEDVSADALLEHCRAHLAAYQVPSEMHLLDRLPLTPAGKLDRMALRDLARV